MSLKSFREKLKLQFIALYLREKRCQSGYSEQEAVG
jgi:hypothetical protein